MACHARMYRSFYFVKGNRETADKYGIVVGTHCEPMMRNSAGEWDIVGKGDYNFLANRENVLNYWVERLKELQESENIFTIGMRRKHDGKMEGVKTIEEYKNALSQVIPAQQELLKNTSILILRGFHRYLFLTKKYSKSMMPVWRCPITLPSCGATTITVISVACPTRKNGSVRESRAFIIIFHIGAGRMIIFGWPPLLPP